MGDGGADCESGPFPLGAGEMITDEGFAWGTRNYGLRGEVSDSMSHNSFVSELHFLISGPVLAHYATPPSSPILGHRLSQGWSQKGGLSLLLG